jgi:hypothetical protein
MRGVEEVITVELGMCVDYMRTRLYILYRTRRTKMVVK